MKPEKNLGAAKPPSAARVSNLRPLRAQVTEPPYTRSVCTVVWEGWEGSRSPYPDLSRKKLRDLTEEETAELELATDEALGKVEPPPKQQHLNPGEEKGYLELVKKLNLDLFSTV